MTVGLCALVFILDGFDGTALGYLAASIADDTHIPIQTFGPLFSAGVFGLMIAVLTTGPIADRWGRKWPVIGSALCFGVFTLMTARATTYQEFLVLRFLAGLGVGGALPNVVALAAEYVPKRMLPVFVAALFSGIPLGSMICGLVSSWMVPAWGWRSVLYVGGVLPLAISLVLIAVLPESIQFLIVRGADAEKLRDILARLSPEFASAKANVSIISGERRQEGVPVKQLFTEGRTAGTILLWIPNFMNLLLIYLVQNWLPALIRQTGMSVKQGVLAGTCFSFGGVVGCLAEGSLLNGLGAYLVLVAEYGLASVFMGSLGYLTGSFSLLATVATLLGFTVIGAQGGLNALAAKFYPTSIRSTGVGWALGVGRVGSIVGPYLGGALLSSGWKPRGILLFGAVFAIGGCLAILLSTQFGGNASAYSVGPERG